MILHHGFADSGEKAGIAVHSHLHVLVFERNEIQGSALEFRQMLRFAEDLAAHWLVEGQPRLEGRNAHVLISPVKAAVKEKPKEPPKQAPPVQ